MIQNISRITPSQQQECIYSFHESELQSMLSYCHKTNHESSGLRENEAMIAEVLPRETYPK